MPVFDFFAWDARGHGRSPGPRGYSPSFGCSVRDVQTFINHIGSTHGIAPHDIHVIAQSVGAVLVATWAHDYAPHVRGLTLASPAFEVKLYVPFARTGLALMRKVRGPFFLDSYVKARLLTHDPARVASHDSDPLIARPIAVDILLGLHRAARRVVADAHAIVLPTQLLISGADWLVRRKPQHRFFEALGSTIKEKIELPGFFHDTLGEKDRAPAVAAVRAFVLRVFDARPEPVDLREADRHGATADEARALSTQLLPYSPRGVQWAVARAGLRLGGLVERVAASGREVRLIDVAAGHGRYALDAVLASPCRIGSILLRDYNEVNVRQGRALIAEKGLADRAEFVKADAFDGESLAATEPRPTVAVVSGLYELFPENSLVRRSLAGLANAVERGGYLVYTGQPWHPQIEMIARVLTSHRNGQPWVMRRRTQAEMDQLVAEAGFRKITQRIDERGIFTVSLAVRD